jgi:peptidoglycan/LPS O-acetylase OafA/YrhL
VKYRPEIDGLRAIAVVPVILFHAAVPGFSGGFVGVDIFFVISGFLITTIIVADMEGRSGFSILRFYEHRARRILPALFAMLAASSVVAYFLLLPSELSEYGKNLVGASLFFSNITHMFQGGYFGGQVDLKPLLHTWSLSVEEQFYVFYPLLVMLFLRVFGHFGLIVFIGIAILASLALADWFGLRYPDYNFYLLPTRAWELGIGAFCALYLVHHSPPDRSWHGPIAALGLFMLGYAVFWLDETVQFPGRWALVPVVGTSLILLFASAGTLVHRVLSLRPLVGIGLISYSAYLWHQPLLAFARLSLEAELSSLTATLLIGATFGLAYASWRWVEKPFRARSRIGRTAIFGLSVAGISVFSALAAVFVQTNGFLTSYQAFQQTFLDQQGAHAYVVGRYNSEIQNQPFNDNGRPRLLIIGDSFSQDFYNIIRETKEFDDFQISGIYIPAKCQLYLGEENAASFQEIYNRAYCAVDGNSLSAKHVSFAKNADVIIFAASWQDWAAQRFPETLGAFSFRADQRVFVVGTKSFGKMDFRGWLNRPQPSLAGIRNLPNERSFTANETLKRLLPASMFIDLWPLNCEAPRSCAPFTSTGELMSADGSHLTPAGASYLGRLIFSRPPLKGYLAAPISEAP